MASGKEIRTKIKSVQNTRKITKAMEMVAASKMRKAQERMRHARPYGDKIRTIAAHLAHANTEYRHPFLVHRENVKDVGLIVVTSDKGLCGGLNTNALRLALNKVREWQGEGRGIQVTAIGNKGFGFMQRFNTNIVSHLVGVGDIPRMDRLVGPVKVQIDAGNVGGPSAGLAFALEVMEELGRDVVHGHKIAATGEIFPDGSVGPIGGIKQKVIGARDAGVDAFLVPAGDNARYAKAHADGLKIIPVESFPQALRALATLR